MDTEQHGQSEWPCDPSGYFVGPLEKDIITVNNRKGLMFSL